MEITVEAMHMERLAFEEALDSFMKKRPNVQAGPIGGENQRAPPQSKRIKFEKEIVQVLFRIPTDRINPFNVDNAMNMAGNMNWVKKRFELSTGIISYISKHSTSCEDEKSFKALIDALLVSQ